MSRKSGLISIWLAFSILLLSEGLVSHVMSIPLILGVYVKNTKGRVQLFIIKSLLALFFECLLNTPVMPFLLPLIQSIQPIRCNANRFFLMYTAGIGMIRLKNNFLIA